MDSEELLAQAGRGHPPERRRQALLADHPLRDYSEGTHLGTFSPGGLENPETQSIWDPGEILPDPHPWDVWLNEFPLEELYRW